MRIAVTGGTGYTGGRLLERLRGRGHEVRALARPDARRPATAGVVWVEGDLAQPDALARLVAGTNAVAHVAANRDREPRVQLRQVLGADKDQLLAGNRLDIEIGDLVDPAREEPAPSRVLRGIVHAARGEGEKDGGRSQPPPWWRLPQPRQ